MNKEKWKHYTKKDKSVLLDIKETKDICHIAASISLNFPEEYLNKIIVLIENTKGKEENGDFICCSSKTLTIFKACSMKEKYDKIEELIATLYSYKNMLPILLLMEGETSE